MFIFLLSTAVVVMFVVLSLRSRTRVAVVINASVWLVLDCFWALICWLAATPGGLDGTGFLQPQPGFPVQAVHVTTAVFGGASVLAALVAVGAGYGYGSSGSQRARGVFKAAVVTGFGLALTAVLLAFVLPAARPSSS